MKFGLALDFATPVRTLDQQIDRYVELLRVAERHGFDSVTAGEGYATRPEWGHVSSPLLVLAALAPRTSLRLGTSVTLLPTWNPLKLAYDAAALDQISGGRLILGIGLGGPAVQRRFGTDPARVGEFVDDALAMMRALWRGEKGFHGSLLSTDQSIGMLPIREGGPTVWVGGSLRRSARRAAHFGDGWCASTNYGFDVIARQSARYREELAREGKPAANGTVAINRLAVVADSDSAARAAARIYAGRVLQRYARNGALGSDPEVVSGEPGQLFERFDLDWCLVGTPDVVIERIQRYVDAGVTQIQMRVSPDDLPLDVAARSVELIGEAVLPKFQ
ncbi:MAG TPA: LLM class flavin-dependent oxidoreductase [Chloroflexota bacterium]|nr:LLM class flavin-dependent oxidoreductase [Chloroflexota bacterium]